MSAAYQHLALAEVRPGMILADEVRDEQGNLLLPKGAVLTAQSISLLPRHGIEAVPVLRPGGPVPAAPADLGLVQERLAHLFRKNDIDDHDDWATGLLRRYVEDYRLNRGIEE